MAVLSTTSPLLLLVLEEMGIPSPIPGDLIAVYTGFQVYKGKIGYIEGLVGLVLATLIGASILYFISEKFGPILINKFGKWLHLSENRMKIVEDNFKKYGVWVIVFGRHLPLFRVVVTVFAGISKVGYKTFISSTLLSVIFWIPLNMYIGEHFGVKAIRTFEKHPWYTTLSSFGLAIAVFVLVTIILRNKEKKS